MSVREYYKEHNATVNTAPNTQHTATNTAPVGITELISSGLHNTALAEANNKEEKIAK